MAVANNGNNVLVDSGGITLAGFTSAAASNIKLVDNKYDITSGAIGSAVNGALQLNKTGAIASLAGTHTLTVTNAVLSPAALDADAPISGLQLDVSGVRLVMTSSAVNGLQTVPMKGDAQTQIIFRAFGTSWNNKHKDVNMDGSTFVYEAGGDGNFCKHPDATVKNVTLLFRSTSPSDFVYGVQQTWTSANKPDAWRGFTLQSISGNNLISLFTWVQPLLTNTLPNNAFQVLEGFTWNVALPGTRPTALRKTYRRYAFSAYASSFWGAVNINPTYLHINLKTTLSATGALNSDPTYLRNVEYAAVGTVAGQTGDDLLAVSFTPTLQNPAGAKLLNTSVVVTNTSGVTSYANPIGTLNARIAASGITAADGQFVITEPPTKDYSSNASHRTDSIVIQNRIKTDAWHKWWEGRSKLITICDSRSTTGVALVTGYAASNYYVSYRQAGSVFLSEALVLDAPKSPLVTLGVDSSYNASASTAGITVTYAAGITTINAVAGSYTLDQLYKSVIDFHATADSNEANTVLPVVQDTGALEFGSALILNFNSTHSLVAGTKVTTLITSQTLTFNGAGEATATFVYTNTNGTSMIWEFADIVAGSSLGVWDNVTGALLYFQQNVTAGTHRYYITPGNTNVYGFAVEYVGNRREYGTFPSNAGAVIGYNADNVQDISVIETNKTTLAAYLKLETATKVNDYEAYWRSTSAGIKFNDTLVRSGETLNWTPYDVKIDPLAADLYSVVGNQVVVRTDVLTANTVTTTGYVTFANGGTIDGVVTDLNGVSTLIKFQGLTGCSLAVFDSTGAVYQFESNKTGVFSIVVPASATGAWDYVITKAGRKYQAGSFTLGSGLPITVDYVEIIDERVVETNFATVQAYTQLETTQKMYDYWSYWVTTAQGIEWYETVTWNGDVLDTDGADLDIDPLAVEVATLEPITNKVIIRATNLSGDLRTDGLVTRLNGATTSGLVTDSTGTTSIITFTGFTGTNKLYVQDELDVQRLFTTVTAAERVLYLLPSEQTAGLWAYAAKKTGYEHAVGAFSVAGGGRVTVQIGMGLIKQPNGQAMYTGSATPAGLSVDWTTSGDGTPRIKLGDQSYNVIEVYDEVDRQMSSLDGLKWLANGYGDVRIATLPAGNFVFLTTGWRFMQSAPGNDNAALNAFSISEDAQNIDNVNGPVSLISSTSALADDDLTKLRQTWQWLNELTLNGSTNTYANFKRIHDFSFIASQNHQQIEP